MNCAMIFARMSSLLDGSRRSVFCIALCLITFLATAQRDVPELANHRVHDDAGILSPSTISYLEQSLRAFEDSTSNQIAILTVPTLEGETIDQFGIRVADAWKLGAKDRDNGIIVLVAIEERKMRIEVGQGLEGPLPDAVCNRIIRNEMAPAFRRQDYDGGVVATIDAIRKSIKGEYRGTGTHRSKRQRLPGGFIILLIIIILIMRSRGNRSGGSGWSSGRGWYYGGGGRGWGGGGGGFGGFSGGGGSFGGGGSSGSW